MELRYFVLFLTVVCAVVKCDKEENLKYEKTVDKDVMRAVVEVNMRK